MFKIVDKKDKTLCVAYRCRNKRAAKQRFCAKHKHRYVKATNPVKYSYNLLKSNAKRRGCLFDLSFEDFEDFCEETGYLSRKGRRADSWHIDRVEIEKGYSKGNLQVLTNTENVKKQHEEDYPCPF